MEIGLLLQILLLIVSLVMIVAGAEFLVDGASAIARKIGISEFVIGLTIVGMGTSAPEMVVSYTGAAKGFSDIALGNILGSNIFNTLLILGVTAMIMPIAITPQNRKRDIPMNIIITVLLLVLGLHKTFFGLGASDTLSRIDGGILIALFVAYMWSAFKQGKGTDSEEQNEEGTKEKSVALSLLMIAGGLAALIFGGDKFVDSATRIAKMAGLSDKFIAITVLAGGTSMPELATCIVAAAKKRGQLALGNILGSNIFNILLILGGSALICPLSLQNINFVDAGVLLLSGILVLLSAVLWKKDEMDRADAAMMLICFAAYMGWLFYNL
ncbi:MAG: calcium/sodium antiporter [Bacteroidales bacterium]|nr:calcium/sodium antiporter [Bacteroidales bacterium]